MEVAKKQALTTERGSLADLGQAFLLSKQVGGCTEATVRAYRAWVLQLRAEVDEGSFDAKVVRTLTRILQETPSSPVAIT